MDTKYPPLKRKKWVLLAMLVLTLLLGSLKIDHETSVSWCNSKGYPRFSNLTSLERIYDVGDFAAISLMAFEALHVVNSVKGLNFSNLSNILQKHPLLLFMSLFKSLRAAEHTVYECPDSDGSPGCSVAPANPSTVYFSTTTPENYDVLIIEGDELYS